MKKQKGKSLQDHAPNHLGNFTCVSDMRPVPVVNSQLLFREETITDVVPVDVLQAAVYHPLGRS